MRQITIEFLSTNGAIPMDTPYAAGQAEAVYTCTNKSWENKKVYR